MDSAKLASIPLFEGMNDDALAECASQFEEIDVYTGTPMTEKDDFGYSMFLVLSGAVSVQRDGKEIAALGPGDFFGEQALASNDRRNATVVASEHSTLAKMMVWDLNELMEKNEILATRIKEVAESRQ